jgi:chitinase
VLWNDVPAGTHSLQARATNDADQTGRSLSLPVTVITPPLVSLTAPDADTVLTAPADITLEAAATATAGSSIGKVGFYQGNALIGTVTAAPYTLTWNNVAAGQYLLTAKAWVQSNLLATTSAAVPVTVTAASSAGTKIYYLHTDHLNSRPCKTPPPRMDTGGQKNFSCGVPREIKIKAPET